jgi:hypothetical protein
VECELEKSDLPYVIIPCSFTPGVERKFRLAVSLQPTKGSSRSSRTRIGKVAQLVPCTSEWKRKCFQGHWSAKYAGGSCAEPSWTQNPQFLVKTTCKIKVAAILTQKSLVNTIGFYLARVTEPNFLTDTKTPILHSVAPKFALESHLQCDLEPGHYILLLCTAKPGQHGDFEIIIYYDVGEEYNLDFEFIPVGADLSFVKFKQPTLEVRIWHNF